MAIENLFDSYILALIDNNLSHLEPVLFDLNSPILTPSIGYLIGIKKLGLRAVKYSNRNICSYILSSGASTVEKAFLTNQSLFPVKVYDEMLESEDKRAKYIDYAMYFSGLGDESH